MPTAKQEVSNLLARLPDDCSLEDVQYHLYVLQKVESRWAYIKSSRKFRLNMI
jgi:hypothetical protein